MRVLLVTNDYPPKPGGIQQYLGNIVANARAEVMVLGPADPRAKPVSHIVRHRRRFVLPTRPTRNWVIEHVAAFDADVVVYGAPHPLAQMGPAVAAATGRPYAVITHGAEAFIPFALPGLRSAVLEPIRKASVVFAVSDYTARRVAGAAGRRVVTLGAGVDLEAYSPAARLRRDPVVVGCVGRFVPRKGQVRVIEAASLLRREGRPVTVLLVGTGRLERRLRALAQRLDVPTRFEIDVAWERLPHLYRDMTVFAMPATSRWGGLEVEGLGIVYLEAAASGLPVIAGPSGGAPETIRPGQTGAIASTTREVAAALRTILDGDLAGMGGAARHWAEERWSWSGVIDRFESELSAVVGPR
ncbi:MAG: glycosyltransferase family 4 protein [Acidimicrobiia bacterium]|nr:glycosyltransferase family 4 protein [Acidimicrobiia bacterium]